MDYFNRCNDEEMGGISYCSCDLTSTGLTTNRISNIKFGDLALDRGNITIDKYDTAINDLSERLKKVSGDYYILTEKIKNLFKQERSNELSEWREFDLEAATGREFETR
jgi:hypothetical protein